MMTAAEKAVVEEASATLVSVAETMRKADAALLKQAQEIATLRGLLNELRNCHARDDDLPHDLLPRIDKVLGR